MYSTKVRKTNRINLVRETHIKTFVRSLSCVPPYIHSMKILLDVFMYDPACNKFRLQVILSHVIIFKGYKSIGVTDVTILDKA